MSILNIELISKFDFYLYLLYKEKYPRYYKTYISFYNEGGKNKIKINGEESTEGLEAKNGKYISTTVITINEKSLSFLHLEYDKDFELNIYINRYTGEMLRYGHVLNEKFSNSAICKKSEIEKSF